MRLLILALFALALAVPSGAAYEDDGLTEGAVSTETVKNGDDEEAQAVIQENDEDLAAFVTDYIRKDIQLKGAFFMENKADKRLFKLELVSVDGKASGGETGAKTVAAVFKDGAGKKHTVLFHLQPGPWGGLDIFKLELKTTQEKTKAQGKKK